MISSVPWIHKFRLIQIKLPSEFQVAIHEVGLGYPDFRNCWRIKLLIYLKNLLNSSKEFGKWFSTVLPIFIHSLLNQIGKTTYHICVHVRLEKNKKFKYHFFLWFNKQSNGNFKFVDLKIELINWLCLPTRTNFRLTLTLTFCPVTGHYAKFTP